MPSLVFMLWLQDPLHQKKDLNLAEWTGWNEMETGSEAGELIRLSEQGESSVAGGNTTGAADREKTVHLDLTGRSGWKVYSTQTFL